MANKPGEANFFPDVPVYPEMGTFQPVYGKFDLTTYIQGASDYEIMAFLVGKYNACLEAYGTITKLSTDTITACKQLKDWINSWFDNLDVQDELNKKIDSMVADGSFGTLLHQTFDTQINQQTTSAVTAWLVANVTPTGSAVVVDKSLSIEGAAADAKATGNKITAVEKNIAEKIPVGVNIKNFLDTSALTEGGYLNTDTGEVIAYSGEYYSDFIATKANDILAPATYDPATANWKILAPMRWCFYDANKTFISGFITNKNTTPVPANAAYMRVSISDYYLHLSSTLVVTNDVLQTMDNPEDRVPYGNIIPTIYDGDGKDRIIVNGGYSVKSYHKLFFKFSDIKYYKNGTSVVYNYNFQELKPISKQLAGLPNIKNV